MARLVRKLSIVLTVLGLIVLSRLGATPTLAAAGFEGASPSSQVPLVATAPAPPSLGPAILNGAPVYVLYVTRSEDTVLTRCYPGFEPQLTVRAMGGNAGQKEGVLTCVQTPGG
ncbi:MAG: hypothetical protein ACFCVD_05730 [Nodosilinea sp.]